MIVGADHLTLTVNGHESGIAALAAIGFRTVFTQLGIPNPAAKWSLMARPAADHDIAFFQTDTPSPAIEAIRHGARVDGPWGPYTPVMPGLPPGEPEPVTEALATERAAIGGAFGLAATRVRWTAAPAPVWAVPSDGPAHVHAVVLACPDLAAERRFWSDGLGLRPASDGPGWALLQVATPVVTWRLSLLLVETPGDVHRTTLDAPGFPCLALVSSALARDAERALEHGGSDATEPFGLLVNGRPLMILMLRAPSGAIVEFIEATRRPPAGARSA